MPRFALTSTLAVAALAAGLLTAGTPAPAQAVAQAEAATTVATARDGRTSSTALASCWDVKQTDRSAADGLYWLYTPRLGYPQQFWCDQTTDGGGWVLIGRGREGWSMLQEGQGSAAEVSATTAGVAAFAPKLLSGTVIDALLGGTAVRDLADGIRVRRATNVAGTGWQEVRLHPTTFGTWRWTLNGGYPLGTTTFDGVSVSGGSTALVASDTRLRRLETTKTSANANLPGFAFGSLVTGSAAATSYLWSPTNAGSAVPFAQVYLRPTTRWSDQTFPALGNGLAGSDQAGSGSPALVSNLAAAQPAGVSGLANGFSTERDTEVRAMVQIGSTMFVGGNFAQVDEYATKTSTPQRYLAAFDATTGGWLRSFAPVLDGKVNALVTLPNGLLAVGGEFRTVNGVGQAGLVVLDPATGRAAPGFGVTVQRRTTTNGVLTLAPGSVTALAVLGSTLYLGGQFTHLSGGGSAAFAYAKGGARVDAGTGRPDATWNPAFDGTPIFVTVSPRGDRVYFGGFMATMNDKAASALRFAVVTTSSPATPVSGLQSWVPSSTLIQYQQTGVEVGDRFWLGGAEHSFFMYDRAGLGLLRGNITRSDSGSGGDFQAAAVDGNVVYGSCHCILSSTYGGAVNWPTPVGFDDIDGLRYVGAYDATTGHALPAFLPQIKTRAVRGPWALAMDDGGCLWSGGDLTQTKSTTGVWQSSGGFARFCRRDAQAPTVPTAFTVVRAVDGTVTARWTGSTDNAAGPLTYSVFRDDAVVWTGTSWKVTLPAADGSARYAIRAFDKAGNVSATTTPVTAGPVTAGP